MISATFRSAEEQMRNFQIYVLAQGYRSPVREDLVAGKEMYMVEVERVMQARKSGVNLRFVSTIIRLDENPIQLSNADKNQEVVYYHCIQPEWSGQCFVHVEDFLEIGYREGSYANDTRYLIKSL